MNAITVLEVDSSALSSIVAFTGRLACMTRAEAFEVVRSRGEIAKTLLGEKRPESELTADEWEIADAIEPGGAAAIAILEHLWAISLREAITSTGGHHVESEWVDAEQLARMGVALTP